MNILISKDGVQQGPYSVAMARNLVLSGIINATDWAWCDGATDWVPLNQMPAFVNHQPPAQVIQVVAPPAKPHASNSPVALVSADHEEDIWKGNPSQLLNLGLYLGWLFFLIGAPLLARFVISAIPDIPKEIVWLAYSFFAGICVIQCAVRVLHVISTRYEITTQRVRVVKGILGRDVQEIELFRVKDTSAQQTLLLRLFSLGNVKIISGDAANPVIFLQAIPQAMDLREKLRQEVIALRQKFGVRELDIMQGS